jgi:cytidine deaminase
VDADPLIAAIRNRQARELVDRARVAADNAHCDYSQFRVGAAVMTEHDTYVGCNVENGSYGLTICAERNAVAKAVAAEGTGMKITAVGLYAHSDIGGEPITISPCGACRQVLAEFDPKERSAAITFLRGGRYVTTTVAKLLPDPFEFTPPAPRS